MSLCINASEVKKNITPVVLLLHKYNLFDPLYYYILPSTQLQHNIMLLQHVSTYNSHLQSKLRTVNALQGGWAYLGPHMAYSVFSVGFLHT